MKSPGSAKLSFEAVLAHLAQLSENRGIRYDLGPVQAALTELGLTDISIPTVQVAGTNGKGSTVWGIAAVLQHLGHRVGVFTSPHIESYTERIGINGSAISEADFMAAFTAISPVANRYQLTEFEALTLMGMHYFKQQKPDYLILETGMGGRLDATTAVKSDLAVITRIGKDHMAILGNTLSKIASEKAGIIRPNTPVVVGPQSKKVKAVFEATASARKSPIYFSKPIKIVPAIKIPYQQENWGTVKTAIDVLLQGKGTAALSTVLAHTTGFWGRFTVIQSRSGTVVIDGAHNSNGLRQLKRGLTRAFPGRPIHLILGILATKDAKSMLKIAATITQNISYCDFDPGKSVPFSEIQSLSPFPIQSLNGGRSKRAHIRNFSLPADYQGAAPQRGGVVKGSENCEDACFLNGHNAITVFSGSLYFIAKLHSMKWT